MTNGEGKERTVDSHLVSGVMAAAGLTATLSIALTRAWMADPGKWDLSEDWGIFLTVVASIVSGLVLLLSLRQKGISTTKYKWFVIVIGASLALDLAGIFVFEFATESTDSEACVCQDHLYSGSTVLFDETWTEIDHAGKRV